MTSLLKMQQHRLTGHAYHGNTPFDMPLITQIDGNLWQGGTPAEVGSVSAHFKFVLDLYPWGRYRVPDGVEVRKAHLYDEEMESYLPVIELAEWVNEKRKEGPILVHCQMGLNRSSLVVALALMLSGMNTDKAIALLREKRSPAVLCNPYFEAWLREWKDG